MHNCGTGPRWGWSRSMVLSPVGTGPRGPDCGRRCVVHTVILPETGSLSKLSNRTCLLVVSPCQVVSMTTISLTILLLHFYMDLDSFCISEDLALKIIAFSLECYKTKYFRISMKVMKIYLTTQKSQCLTIIRMKCLMLFFLRVLSFIGLQIVIFFAIY